MLNNLNVNVLRGLNKIGENLIEVTCDNTCILLEYGISLESTLESKKIEEYVVNKYYDAVIITHYHLDHSGLLKINANTNKIYMGEKTYKILEYNNCISDNNISKISFLENEQVFYIGDIRVKPYLCDHSAIDSYMIELSKNNEVILYTGDYRANGRKNFNLLLNKLPSNIDVLIMEHTNKNLINKTEKHIENEAFRIMKKYKKIFILQSTLNMDRLVSFYKASKKSTKKFIMTKSQSNICSLFDTIPNPISFHDCFIYFDHGCSSAEHAKIKDKYGKKLLSKNEISKLDTYTMCINSKMINYIKMIINKNENKDVALIYSMWNGYKENMRDFLMEINDLEIDTFNLHVSGHADVTTIKKLISKTNPNEIITVHVDKNVGEND